MLEKSDTSLSDVLARFTKHGLEVAFLVPTETGLNKSILDAIGPFRDFLVRKQFHDFASQHQAEKSCHPVFFVLPDGLQESTVSLYRPQTKQGDPRVWFYGLGKYSKPYNLLAILCEEGKLYVANVSRQAILDSLEIPNSPLARLARSSERLEPAATELLHLLKGVSRKGYVPSLRGGDTGVGYTLESLLGIRANVERTPDFKGIEIKASRRISGASRENRVTLFSQVPEWSSSRLGSGMEILRSYGYERGGRLQLYCTVGSKPNPQGLYFDISSGDVIWNKAVMAGKTRDVVCWSATKLQSRLLEKHPSTMWVKARCRGARASCEEFHYVEAIFTRNPVVTSLLPLIEDGIITMDYTLSDQNGRARDHGYLFKIPPDNLPSLFPPPRRFDLTSD